MNTITDLEAISLDIGRTREKLAQMNRDGKAAGDAWKYYQDRLKRLQAFYAELKSAECKYCKSPSLDIGVQIAQNLAVQVRLNCVSELHPFDPVVYLKFISHKIVPDDYFKRLTVVVDYSNGAPRCAVCGRPGVELHHWAPRAYFPDNCEMWPKDYLCKIHHAEWHRTVTPNLTNGGKRESSLTISDALS